MSDKHACRLASASYTVSYIIDDVVVDLKSESPQKRNTSGLDDVWCTAVCGRRATRICSTSGIQNITGMEPKDGSEYLGSFGSQNAHSTSV